MSGKSGSASKGSKGNTTKGSNKGGGDTKTTDIDIIQEQKEEIKRLKLRIETLERYLVLRSEQTQKAKSQEQEMKSKFNQLDEDFEKEKMERFHIASDMIRQYKSLQKTLIDKLNVSEQKNTNLSDQLHLTKIALQELRKEKDQIIEMKQREIEEQRQKMQSMVVEFSAMLKETLNKMGNTIQQEYRENIIGGNHLENVVVGNNNHMGIPNLINNTRLSEFLTPEMLQSLNK
ncbi:hypothetical protein ABK040_003792 [Willaertia magna]